MNPTARLFSIALGAMCFAGAATAQFVMYDNTAENYVQMPELDRLYWPSGATPNFRRLVAGDFRADQSLDVAVLEGNALHLWHDPSFANHRVELASSDVNDVDVAAQGAGQADALAIVRSTGLFVVTLPISPSNPPIVTAVSTSNPSVWNGATLVRCADFNSDGVTDYVGLASDGLTILRLIGGSGGATDSFVSPHTVRDLGLFMWDLDSHRELAVATSSGMFVHELVGAGAWSPAATYDSGDDCFTMSVLRGASRDRIAWAVDYSVADEVHVARNGYPLEPVQLAIGMEVVGLSAADGDGDGDIDIMVNTRQHLAPIYIRNYNPTIPAFATAFAWAAATVDNDPLLPTLPASNNNCPPLFRDFDYDGRADLFLALPQTTSTLNQSPAGVFMPFTDVPGVPLEIEWIDGGGVTQSGSGQPVLRLSLTADILPTVNGVTANALDVIVYRQSVAFADLEPGVLAHQLYRCDNVNTGDKLHIWVGINDNECFLNSQSQSGLYWFEIWPRCYDWGTTWPESDPVLIRNYARKFAAVGATEASVCDYLIDTGGEDGRLLNDLLATYVPESTSLLTCTGAIDCLSEGTGGTTQGPAAVIRVRLPTIPPNTEYPTTRTPQVCPGSGGAGTVPPPCLFIAP